MAFADRSVRATRAWHMGGVLTCEHLILQHLARMEHAPRIRVGTAGWSYKDWDGILYPPEVTRKKVHPVEFLAKFFDVIEINTSFYGHIRPELGRLWSRKAGAVNPNFLFTAKLHRSFTHSPLAVFEPTSGAPIGPQDAEGKHDREGLDARSMGSRLARVRIVHPISVSTRS